MIASKRLIESTCRGGSDRALTPHPLPWLQEILNGVEFANFFEQRATEYSKAATRGRWDGEEGVWSSFEQSRSATLRSA